jgi:hypothetical protein
MFNFVLLLRSLIMVLSLFTARSFSCVSTYYPYHLVLNVLIIGLPFFISVNTAVFSIAPGSLFTIDTYARSAIAASSIASGLGIVCDAWFLLRYNWADLQTFIVSTLVSHLLSFVYLIFELASYDIFIGSRTRCLWILFFLLPLFPSP